MDAGVSLAVSANGNNNLSDTGSSLRIRNCSRGEQVTPAGIPKGPKTSQRQHGSSMCSGEGYCLAKGLTNNFFIFKVESDHS